jgi:hypothetical protein
VLHTLTRFAITSAKKNPYQLFKQCLHPLTRFQWNKSRVYPCHCFTLNAQTTSHSPNHRHSTSQILHKGNKSRIPSVCVCVCVLEYRAADSRVDYRKTSGGSDQYQLVICHISSASAFITLLAQIFSWPVDCTPKTMLRVLRMCGLKHGSQTFDNLGRE